MTERSLTPTAEDIEKARQWLNRHCENDNGKYTLTLAPDGCYDLTLDGRPVPTSHVVAAYSRSKDEEIERLRQELGTSNAAFNRLLLDAEKRERRLEEVKGVLAKIAAENCGCGGSDPNWHSDRCFKKRAEAALGDKQ